jgi:HAE1 family hydrophobic/amphiphilic exporter-1
VPQSFVPDEDQSWFMVVLQAPEGASLGYTMRALAEAEAALAREPEVASSFSVGGFSFSGASPNRAIVFVNMKPLAERKGASHSVATVVDRLRGPLGAISSASVVPFLPPPLEGVGNFGGFQFEVQAEGGATLQRLYEVTRDLTTRGNARPELRGLFSGFTANDPQFLVTIDRETTTHADHVGTDEEGRKQGKCPEHGARDARFRWRPAAASQPSPLASTDTS